MVRREPPSGRPIREREGYEEKCIFGLRSGNPGAVLTSFLECGVKLPHSKTLSRIIRCRIRLRPRPANRGVRCPFPVAYLGHVLTMSAHVFLVLNEPVAHGLLDVGCSYAQARHALDDVLDEVEAVQVVPDRHVERRRCRGLREKPPSQGKEGRFITRGESHAATHALLAFLAAKQGECPQSLAFGGYRIVPA